MRMVEVKCKNCGKNISVLDRFVREDMFCTLRCMDQYDKTNNQK